MAKKQFDFIVFDWDGTLMDSTAAIVKCIQLAAKDLNLPIPSQQQASFVIGLSLQEAMRVVMPDVDPSIHAKMVERYRYHYLLNNHELPLFDGALDMLIDLKNKGYFLAVATGKARVGLNRALNSVDLLSFFDATRCADETFSKPHPAMLHELTRELGQDMQRTLMIGDTTHDLQMATNAGAACVAVEYGAHDAVTLRSLSPLYSAQNVMQLHTWLSEHA